MSRYAFIVKKGPKPQPTSYANIVALRWYNRRPGKFLFTPFRSWLSAESSEIHSYIIDSHNTVILLGVIFRHAEQFRFGYGLIKPCPVPLFGNEWDIDWPENLGIRSFECLNLLFDSHRSTECLYASVCVFVSSDTWLQSKNCGILYSLA